MAAALDPAAERRIDALGIRSMAAPAALDALDIAFPAGLTDPLVAAVAWERYAGRHPSGPVPLLLSALVAGGLQPAAAAGLLTGESAVAGKGVFVRVSLCGLLRI